MRAWKRAVPALAAAVLLLVGCYTAAWVLVPPRQEYGGVWDAYLQEEPDSLDVVFFGSSTVYCNVIPALVWESSGLRSFVMAGPSQQLGVTYYYVREACKSQHPQAIALEVSSLFFERYTGYTKANLDYMPWSLNRVLASVKHAEPEQRLEVLFPLAYYHDRVYEVEREEIEARLSPQESPLAGYTLLTGGAPQSGEMVRPVSAQTAQYRENLDALKKIAAFCRERDMKLILFLAPSYDKLPPEALETMEADISALDGVSYFRCDGESWPTQDAARDWYDYMHLNFYGAVPFSRRLGEELASLGLKATGENRALWEERVAYLEGKKAH